MSTLQDKAKTLTADISLAGYRDAFAIHDTIAKVRAESETPYPEAEMPYAIQALLDLIAQGLVIVARSVDDKTIAGCIVLDIGHWPWVSPRNPAGHHLYNQHFWVEPQSRKGGTAARMIRMAQSIADDRKLPLILEISSIDESNGDLRDRFVKMQGFRYTGGKFYRAPKE